MPWLPLYLANEDVKQLSEWLSAESDLAIVSALQPGKWIAQGKFNIETDGRYCLFHVPSGPLPLLSDNVEGEDALVLDPFQGWEERRKGADPTNPYFGPGCPAIFWFNVRLGERNCIGMSSFEWIGNHYSIIGNGAPPAAHKWWGRLRRWVKKNAQRIPRAGPVEGSNPEVWAFGSALDKIQKGAGRANNP